MNDVTKEIKSLIKEMRLSIDKSPKLGRVSRMVQLGENATLERISNKLERIIEPQTFTKNDRQIVIEGLTTILQRLKS